MIIFDKKSFGFNPLFFTTFLGSAWTKAIPASAISLGLHLAMTRGLSEEQRGTLRLEHPYAIGVIFAAIGFLIVYRANHAYNRMGEGAAWLFHLESRLMDSLSQSTAFHMQSDAYRHSNQESETFLARLHHLHSLVLVLSCLSLRRDAELNVQAYDYADISSDDAMNSLRIPSETLKQFRPQNPLLWLHYAASMRGSHVVRAKYNASCKLPVFGGVSDQERRALQQCRAAKSRVHVAMQWLTEFTTRGQGRGMFGSVPPPVISRLYQWHSESMLGFSKAQRVVDVPFPFIIAQIAELSVLSLVFLVPLLQASFVQESDIAGSVLCFLTCLLFVGLYESARDVEDPFVYEPNDLPLKALCLRFCEAIADIRTHPVSPDDPRPAPPPPPPAPTRLESPPPSPKPSAQTAAHPLPPPAPGARAHRTHPAPAPAPAPPPPPAPAAASPNSAAPHPARPSTPPPQRLPAGSPPRAASHTATPPPARSPAPPSSASPPPRSPSHPAASASRSARREQPPPPVPLAPPLSYMQVPA